MQISYQKFISYRTGQNLSTQTEFAQTYWVAIQRPNGWITGRVVDCDNKKIVHNIKFSFQLPEQFRELGFDDKREYFVKRNARLVFYAGNANGYCLGNILYDERRDVRSQISLDEAIASCTSYYRCFV